VSSSRTAPKPPRPQPAAAEAPAGLWAAWVRFWFTPGDPVGLHALRVLAGLLFLAWLLPFAGQVEAFFGLGGWFDATAYGEAVAIRGGPVDPQSWSILYLCGSDPLRLQAVYWLSVAVVALFTLGLATRLTSVLTWVAMASFTTNPAIESDPDIFLRMLGFYLMIGYVFLGQGERGLSWLSRLVAPFDCWLFRRSAAEAAPSAAATVALRLFQVHFAVAMVATGLHKLQFGEWWAGASLWFPLHRPMESTPRSVYAWASQKELYLSVLGVAAYAILAWQIAFPVFAWRPRLGRLLLVGGAAIGWLGLTLLYRIPLMGPVLFVSCLSYLTAAEWHRLGGLLAAAPGLGGLVRRLTSSGAKGARASAPVVSVGHR
jgi:hypothetical protein